MLNGVGSVGVVDASGRLGVVVGARAVGTAGDGSRLMSYTVRTTEAAGRVGSGLPVDPATGEVLPPQAQAVAGAVDPALARVVRRDTGLPANEQDMSERDQAALAQLRQRDAQVRQEENAHAGAAGSIAGPIVYTYQRGPDGRMYAVGGSVSINAQTFSNDPQEARALGARIAAAANAATNPSGADMRAASMGDGIRAYGNAQALAAVGGAAEAGLAQPAVAGAPTLGDPERPWDRFDARA